MKVDLLQSNRALNGSVRTSYEAGKTKGSDSARISDAPRVRISEDARWIAELQGQAQNFQEVREPVVSEVQGQLVLGNFDSSVDMDRVLESLLSDL